MPEAQHVPSAPAVRGWCPTAWRPMMAGDGLLVRIRPPLGRLNRTQSLALTEAACRHGNGTIDLTNRAALQIRGVTEQSHRPLLNELIALGLTDPDPTREARRAIMLTPDWTQGDETESIARSLFARLDELPVLPAKIGIAIDTGPVPCLAGSPADFRLERSETGMLLLRADGHALGVPTTFVESVDALIALARWFMATGGEASGRMSRHNAPLPFEPWLAPASARSIAQCLAPASGTFHGIPFGQLQPGALAELIAQPGTAAIRLTPWRGLILEGGTAPPRHAADDPLLRIDACPGAPACPQASVSTRDLAVRLAPHATGSLHISGCAKGCARPASADMVLTGREGRFDLARHARAGSPPDRTALAPDQILALFGAH